jgi:hypothetical protein
MKSIEELAKSFEEYESSRISKSAMKSFKRAHKKSLRNREAKKDMAKIFKNKADLDIDTKAELD